ncbi:MAG TPA: cysteine--tRNA ligase [Acidimicrobiia bacterium]|nr:cysteine--tRNA ligase [Acidimicrobiia bacterium]
MIRLHDTFAREKVELVPRDPGHVSIYVCGPTVYEVPHVGHGRAALVFDVIRRYLEWRGFDVVFVSNVTDVEDKIIERAAKEGTTEPELAQRYEAAYWAEMDRLDVRRPDSLPRATAYIDRMVKLIGELVDTGRAYVVEGQGVYFDVTSFPEYGELAHRRLEDLLGSAGARVDVDERKRNPVDFALWKSAKPGEPAWDSPWGKGRPGWHIECSAMSLDLLGDGFDIHGGGDDLIFPHHENERAQAQGAGHPFARYWVHNGMVMVGTEKMAKSLGNFTTLKDALDAHGPRAMRMAVLQTHYRSPVEIGDGQLDAAGEAVTRLDALARRARVAEIPAEAPLDESATAKFREAMDDDFGTPEAMAVVFRLARDTNSAIDEGDVEGAASGLVTVRELTGALGLELDDGGGSEDADIDAMVQRRDDARSAHDFAEADRIRAELAARGITLEDTPTGTIWHR